jgi:hypothetical protein
MPGTQAVQSYGTGCNVIEGEGMPGTQAVKNYCAGFFVIKKGGGCQVTQVTKAMVQAALSLMGRGRGMHAMQAVQNYRTGCVDIEVEGEGHTRQASSTKLSHRLRCH